MTQSTLWCNSCLDCLWVSDNNLMLRFVENFYPFHFQDLISKSLLLSAIQFLWWWFSEFGIGSTNSPLVDIFLYSQHLSAWQWTDVVRRCSILVMGVKGFSVFWGRLLFQFDIERFGEVYLGSEVILHSKYPFLQKLGWWWCPLK